MHEDLLLESLLDARAVLENFQHLGLKELPLDADEGAYLPQLRIVASAQRARPATAASGGVRPGARPERPGAPPQASPGARSERPGIPLGAAVEAGRDLSRAGSGAQEESRFGPSRLNLGELGPLLSGVKSPAPSMTAASTQDRISDLVLRSSSTTVGERVRAEEAGRGPSSLELSPAPAELAPTPPAEEVDPRQANMFSGVTRRRPRIETARSGFDGPAPEDRVQAMLELKSQIGPCTRCALSRSRNLLMHGEGALDAEVFFVLGAPGRNEEAAGTLFAAEPGALLERIVTTMLKRSRAEVYVTGAVLCAPPPGDFPAREELQSCHPFLARQISIVRPRVIVTMGPAAAHALLASGEPLHRLQGFWYEYAGIPVRPTFHPESLLRDPSLKRPVFDDMQAVVTRLSGRE